MQCIANVSRTKSFLRSSLFTSRVGDAPTEAYITSISHTKLLSFVPNLKSLPQTKQTHAISLLTGLLPRSISLSASLILRYATFHSPATCHLLFKQTVQFSRSAFLWNTLIRALSIAKLNDNFKTYNQMLANGVLPDDHTFPFVLKACADTFNFRKGIEVHSSVLKLGFDYDVYIGNTLLLFYGSCGRISDLRKVFDEMPERDVVSWNSMISVLSLRRFHVDAIGLFCEMKIASMVRLNLVSVVSVLPVCAALGDELMVGRVHCDVVKCGLDCEVKVGNALIDAYGKCGNLEVSLSVFDVMVLRNEVSWNAVITSLVYRKSSDDALEFFRLMISEGVRPNAVTVSSMLPVLVELEGLKLGREIHGFCLRCGMESDVFIANSLIDMYGKLGCSSHATNLFCGMEERNVVSWNAQIANFAQNSLELAAVSMVREMVSTCEVPNSVTFTNVLPACARLGLLRSGKEIHARAIRLGCFFDLFVSNALTDMYAKCGCLDLARGVFSISDRDEVSYNILILGFSQTARCSESISLFLQMGMIGMNHDVVSYMGAISACSNLTAFKQGKGIHGLLIRKHLDTHLFIANSLLDFYSKCVRIDIARIIFDRIAKRDATSWNTMILGYGMLSELNIAINLFEAMKKDGVKYDSVSYIAVLTACSHGGLVEKGKNYFEQMIAENIKPTQMHYACIVDLLGRAGAMKEAVEVIKGMPIEPDANTWGALLGACRICGNLELACWAAEHLFKLKPQHSGYYAILSNMFAEAGKWDEANRVRELMKSRGAKKNPGCSWVQVNDRLHAFVAGEKIEKFGPSLWIAEY